MVSLRGGSDPEAGLRMLSDAAREARNVLGAGGSAVDLFNRYLAWAAAQERLLAGSLPEREIERLLTTRRYWTIQAMDPIAYGAALSDVITLEVNARAAAFEGEKEGLERDMSVWNVASTQAAFGQHLHAVVVDTNVLMRHKGEMTQLDWSAVAGTHPTQSIAITVPAVVVAELDDLKHSNGRMTFEGVAHERRWLATLAIRWLESTFPGVERRALIREAEISDGGPTPQLYAVLQSDPLDHIALTKADSEIIDNALRLASLAKTVTLASYDAHMIFTARHLGVRAHKLREPSGEIPGEATT